MSRHPRGRLVQNTRVRTGLVLVGLLVTSALLAPLITPFDPNEQLGVTTVASRPPSLTHLMGTDNLSRDVLSRVLHGIRASLIIAISAMVIAVTIGTAVGLVAGYAGGLTDAAVMRLVDAALGIPRTMLLLLVIAVFGRSLIIMVAVLGMTSWFGISRLVRAETLSIKERDFVHAAAAAGLGRPRLLWRHLLPNVLAPVIVTATLGIGHIILIEAGISFLGAGVLRPRATLGRMIADGTTGDLLTSAPWISFFPGVVIVFAVVAFSLIGDGLQRTVTPQTR